MTRVRVVITGTGFRLSRSTVPIGTVVFSVVNRDGALSHDFAIAAQSGSAASSGKTPPLEPGRHFVLRVRFRSSGRYQYVSTLPEQAERGFAGVLVVR